MNNIIVTVFTPTYNRVELLKRLYKSLIKQTNYCFEWVICDDCSTDDTLDYLRKLNNQAHMFPIRFFSLEKNGGKHRAINFGLSQAKGKLFFIVDSDDELVENAIENIILWEKTIQSSKHFAGLGFCKGYTKNKIIGTTFQGDYIDCTSLERDTYNLKGDKAEVFYTEILKEYPFPEFDNENFLTEAVVWDRIAYDNYKIRWINKIIYLCEYQSDGLSARWNYNLRNNFEGYTLFIYQKIHFSKLSKRKKYYMVEGYYQNNNCNRNLSILETCKRLDYPIFEYLFFKGTSLIRKYISQFLKILKLRNVK